MKKNIFIQSYIYSIYETLYAMLYSVFIYQEKTYESSVFRLYANTGGG